MMIKGEDNYWAFRVLKTEPVTIIVKDGQGNVVGKKKFLVYETPQLIVFLDSTTAQSVINFIPNEINLQLPPSIPLEMSFFISSWTVEIDGEIFTGRGRSISKELAKHLESKRSGIIIFKIIYKGPLEEKEITEIFRYSFQ